MRVFAVFCLLLAPVVYAEERTPQQLFQDAKVAYDRHDYAAYLGVMETLHAMRPSHPIVGANYAGALALSSRADDAVAQLRRLAAMQIAIDLSDHDFDSLRGREDFRDVERRIAAVRTAVVRSDTKEIRIPQKDLITEAIAWDRKGKAFLVSANRKRKIIKVDLAGRVTDFATDGIWGANGLGIDEQRRIVWATSSPSARAEGFEEAKDAKSELVALDLDSGAVTARYTIPDDGQKHFLDDLTVADDGTVYVSDSTGMMFRLRPKSAALEQFVPRGTMRSPQGSAMGRGALYVADYGGGIWRVDPATGGAKLLETPNDLVTFGIDGLEYRDGSLVAVQNGVEPNRVVRLWLDAAGRRVTRWKVIEANHPLMDEPTIGTFVGSDFWLVAASQGNKFDTKKTELLHDAVLLRIRVK